MIIDLNGVEKYIGLQESRVRAQLLTSKEAAAEVSKVRRFLEHAGTAETPKQVAYLRLVRFEARLLGRGESEPLLPPTGQQAYLWADGKSRGSQR